MITVTFLTPPMMEKLVVEVPANARVTLLNLMKHYNFFRQCVCGEGRCGSCAVKVAPLRTNARRINLSDAERHELFQAGKLSLEESKSQDLKDIPPRWRLACQYVVADEPLLVAF